MDSTRESLLSPHLLSTLTINVMSSKVLPLHLPSPSQKRIDSGEGEEEKKNSLTRNLIVFVW